MYTYKNVIDIITRRVCSLRFFYGDIRIDSCKTGLSHVAIQKRFQQRVSGAANMH